MNRCARVRCVATEQAKTNGMEEALVMIRAQWREKERAEAEQDAKEDRMGATTNPIEEFRGGDDKESK